MTTSLRSSNGLEFFIRGAGFVKSVADVENIVIRQEVGTPISVKNVATVQLGPDFRRGTLDNAGKEAVGGVVLMRYGVNPLEVINRVKIAETKGETTKGKSIATANYYLTAVKGFTRWLWKDRRVVSDPLAGLSKLANGQTDIRHARRDLSPEEFAFLLDTVAKSERGF